MSRISRADAFIADLTEKQRIALYELCQRNSRLMQCYIIIQLNREAASLLIYQWVKTGHLTHKEFKFLQSK
jgi:hypothetical protein